MTKQQYKKRLIGLFVFSLIFSAVFSLYYVRNCRKNEQLTRTDSVPASAKLPEYVYPGGYPAGIYLETEGVLIVGTGTVVDFNGCEQDPAGDQILPGDYIISVNGKNVAHKEEISELVRENACQPVALTLRRGSELCQVELTPVQTEDHEYRLGIWIRDDTQGIGTLTYITEDGHFGALGHGISDIDTGQLVESQLGELYQARIHSVIKGSSRQPGSLCGSIHYTEASCLGEIEKNSSCGIFGSLSPSALSELATDPVAVAPAAEVTEGPAVILSAASGEMKSYPIEILELNRSDESSKNMILKVTDPELIRLTGGIVQGMSGSPILQNGKLVGAVTHVLVNNPTEGYGILIENMMKKAN